MNMTDGLKPEIIGWRQMTDGLKPEIIGWRQMTMVKSSEKSVKTIFPEI
jgi:hypothetical protein